MTEGDKDDMIRGLKLRNEISDEIDSSRLTSTLKIELQKSLINPDSIINTYRNAIRLGIEYETDLLEQQMR